MVFSSRGEHKPGLCTLWTFFRRAFFFFSSFLFFLLLVFSRPPKVCLGQLFSFLPPPSPCIFEFLIFIPGVKLSKRDCTWFQRAFETNLDPFFWVTPSTSKQKCLN